MAQGERVGVAERGYEIAAESIAKVEGEPNQDHVLQLPDEGLIGAFDGAGGREDGADASRVAAGRVAEVYAGQPDGVRTLEQERWLMAEALMQAGQAVIAFNQDKGREERRNALSTAALAKVYIGPDGSRRYLAASVGDARVYRWAVDGTLHQITVDNVYDGMSEDQVDRKRISQHHENSYTDRSSPRESDYFDRRHIISQAIGSARQVRPRIEEGELKPGELLLVMSDGVHDNLTTVEMEQAIRQAGARSSAEITAALVQAAHARSAEMDTHDRAKLDDITALALSCPEAPAPVVHETALPPGYSLELPVDRIEFPVTLKLGGWSARIEDVRGYGHVNADFLVRELGHNERELNFQHSKGMRPNETVELGRYHHQNRFTLMPPDTSRDHAQVILRDGQLIITDARPLDSNPVGSTTVLYSVKQN
jgi:protein phosphatase